MTPPLYIENLSVGYDKKPLFCVEQFTIQPGELVVLTGRNGSGKSSLLRCICGLQKPLSGHIALSGLNVNELQAMDRARRVSIVLTDMPHLAGIDVFTLAGMGRFPHGDRISWSSPAHKQAVMDALEDTGMAAFANRGLASLSDGELQKVMVARAICQDTPLILLDEPTAFLDYEAREDLMKLLMHLAATRGKAVLFSSHDLETAFRYAQIRLHVEGGKATQLALEHTK